MYNKYPKPTGSPPLRRGGRAAAAASQLPPAAYAYDMARDPRYGSYATLPSLDADTTNGDKDGKAFRSRSINTSATFRRRGRYLLLLPLILLLYLFPPHHILRSTGSTHPAHTVKNVDWSRYAYSLYATNQAYLCNAVMVFDQLKKYGSKADRLLFYPGDWDTVVRDGDDRISQLLVKVRDEMGVELVPVDQGEWKGLLGQEDEKEEKEREKRDADQEENRDEKHEKDGERENEKQNDKSRSKDDGKQNVKSKSGWEGGFLKFMAWSQTTYARIMHLDTDITLHGHLDDLFLLPPASVAMTRAYWLPSSSSPSHHDLTSLLVLLEPSESAFKNLMAAAKEVLSKGEGRDWDMEILNTMYGDEALVLPHKGLVLLSGELRLNNHSNYMGSLGSPAIWSPRRMVEEARVLHFSDWPCPKPWVMWPSKLLPEIVPQCGIIGDGGVTPMVTDGGAVGNGRGECEERKVWMGVYDEFRKRRKDVCMLLSEVAPDWPPKQGTLEMEWLEERKGLRKTSTVEELIEGKQEERFDP